jgi:hypothetical protein
MAKTAVVVIHGIGEQRPLGTIKEFVETVYRRDRSLASGAVGPSGMLDVPIVPDSSTGSAELRRLTTLADGPEKRTDFFELYWADIMDGTPVDMVTGWIRTLLLRSPWKLPHALKVRRAWRILLSGVLLIILCGVVTAIPDGLQGLQVVQDIGYWLNLIRPYLAFALIGVALLVLSHRAYKLDGLMRAVKLSVPFYLLVGGVALAIIPTEMAGSLRFWAGALTVGATWGLTAIVTPYAGDVVRYVRATPSTVERRRQVRERGMALLEALHRKRADGDEQKDFTQTDASQPPLYDRIVIVGHSLGTIIAYDLLQLFWERHGPTHHQEWPVATMQDALKEADKHVKTAWGDDPTTFDAVAFAASQDVLFKLLRDEKPHWRISDLITLGSPLTHAEFLLADDEAEVEQAFVERRFATCPPRPDPMRNGSMLFPPRGENGPLYPHFASQFSVVRWTNIYDENANPLLGDLISGSLAGSYGIGIVEHPVTIEKPTGPKWLRRVFTHTQYWRWDQSYEPGPDNLAKAKSAGTPEAKRKWLWYRIPDHIRHLRLALRLGS